MKKIYTILTGMALLFGFGTTGQHFHDLRISKDSVAVAPAFAIPSCQIMSGLDYPVQLGGVVSNVGDEDATNVSLSGRLSYNVPNGGGVVNYYDGSFVVPFLAANESHGDVIGIPVYIFPPYIGEYSITYEVTSDSVDDFPMDNTYQGGFLITESAYSLCRLDPVTEAPIATDGLRPASGNNMMWGVFLPIIYGNWHTHFTSITFSGAVDAPDSLLGITTIAFVYEWRDINNDSLLNDLSELTLVGSNYGYVYPDVPNYTPVTTDLYNLNFGELELSDNTIYFVAIEYTGQATRPYYYNADAGINYEIYTRATGYQEQALLVDSVFYNGFEGGAVPVIVVDVVDTICQNPIRAHSIALGLARVKILSNPVTTTLNVNITFPSPENNVFYQITDAQGRAVMFERRGSVSSETFTHDVSALSNGTYYFSVKSESGRQTVAFTVAK